MIWVDAALQPPAYLIPTLSRWPLAQTIVQRNDPHRNERALMTDSSRNALPIGLLIAGVLALACLLGLAVLGVAGIALYFFGVSSPVTSAPVGGAIPPPQPVPTGQIVFSTGRDGNFEIYTINSDGTNLTRLTDDSADDLHPEWSPDGTQIAFNSNRDGEHGIYVMEADGSNVTRIAEEGVAPAWSPDGTQIVFSGSDTMGIYVIDADGTNETQLTNDDDSAPVWSPDGSQIVFSRRSVDGSISALIAMNADGSGITQLTDAPGYSYNPVWSPDGTMIAFISDRDGTPQLYVMNADGSQQVQLTFLDSVSVGTPSWSFDGQYLVVQFTSDVSDSGLYLIPVSGGSSIFLIDEEPEERDPDWSPIP
jgi:Tol biopolymer transport system component